MNQLRVMIRALFFVVGLFALLQGGICLTVESMTVSDLAAEHLARWTDENRTLVVPMWFGPTLVLTGGVTLLYAIALPAKQQHRRRQHMHH